MWNGDPKFGIEVPKIIFEKENMYRNIKIMNKALSNAHKEGCWDQEQYDLMYELVNEYKKKLFEEE